MNEGSESCTETLDWGLSILRFSVAVLVAKPALSKFVTYENSVSFFEAFGIPFPETMVLVAGFIEVGAVLLLLFDVRTGLAAVSLVPVMIVAITYVGLDWKNGLVLLSSLVILVLDTNDEVVRELRGRLVG